MGQNNILVFENPSRFSNSLTELLRRGASQLLACAIEAEDSPKAPSTQARHRDLVSAQEALGVGEESEGSQALNIAVPLATLGNNNLIGEGLFRWKTVFSMPRS
jgi:hypothetical protein